VSVLLMFGPPWVGVVIPPWAFGSLVRSNFASRPFGGSLVCCFSPAPTLRRGSGPPPSRPGTPLSPCHCLCARSFQGQLLYFTPPRDLGDSRFPTLLFSDAGLIGSASIDILALLDLGISSFLVSFSLAVLFLPFLPVCVFCGAWPFSFIFSQFPIFFFLVGPSRGYPPLLLSSPQTKLRAAPSPSPSSPPSR